MMSEKDLGQSLENMEEGIENLKNREFRVFGIKVTFMTASAALAVIGSVIGTLYGGFLMYQKVEQAIAFVEQQTEYEEKIAGFDKRMELIESKLEEAVGYTNEIRGDLKSDIRRLEGVVDSVERSSKQLQRETLADVKDMRDELRDTRKEVEREMKEQKADLEKKLKEAIDNPLAEK
jgi:vacuolar-type H+-ATPase subunit I/STV1